MLKYNLKDFFKEVTIHNDEWISNGHFMFRKSILTVGQQKMLEDFPQDTNRIKSLIDVAESTKERFEGSKEKFEFAPDLIFEAEVKGIEGEIKESYSVLYNNELDLALREEYYNLFISRGCKIFKGNGSLNPTLIFKDNEFVGILLPIRHNSELRKNAIDYNSYITQLKQQHEEKDELKKLNKKCLYIRGNKAIVRNIPLIPLTNIVKSDNDYGNLYISAIPCKHNNTVEAYIDLGIVFMEVRADIKIDQIKNDVEWTIGKGYNTITLEWYKNHINESLANNRWINVAEVKLMELAGESEEYINELWQHRENILKLREKEEKEKQLKREQEEKEYIESQNKLVDDAVTETENKILKGEKIINNDMTIYEDKYTYNTTSLILHMMKLYDIKVPLKTQGWINKALHNINYNNDGWGYQYYKTSSDSTVFHKYLDMLVDKVKERHNLNITA
ncbi:hypothetical protein ACR77J_07820 [Tissierella praeacuta]|uniref:hypothetical protein n=1 Tax=Tissierella praeacuta TaxID=43131 RepID=UPI003DA53C1C